MTTSLTSAPWVTAIAADAWFAFANATALLGWLALACSPPKARWAAHARWLAGRALPVALAVLYVLLFASMGLGDGGYGSLAEVQRLMSQPHRLTAGWIHYLAFDLLVGAWIATRAAALGWPHALTLPLLLLTFLFGPGGLLGYALLRSARALPWRSHWRELRSREPRLARFACFMLAAMLLMAMGWALDPRQLREANVWIKPIKFALSSAVLAVSTAWFIGHLMPNQRQSRAVTRIVWLLIASASFEVGYIALQAGLGQASHYNVGDWFHGLMYSLMGVSAVVLISTQPMLAWQLRRHADPQRPAAHRQAVQLGLWLAFILGGSAAALLSARQPPGGASLPLLGWALAGGDLRPAHFVGLHAEQILPLVGWWASRKGATAGGRRWVWVAALALVLLWAAAMAWGLHAGKLALPS